MCCLSKHKIHNYYDIKEVNLLSIGIYVEAINIIATAIDDTLSSNYPAGCTAGIDCYSALNYYKDANIHSNICHYVSLSMPSYNTGESSSIISLPIYASHNRKYFITRNMSYYCYKIALSSGFGQIY